MRNYRRRSSYGRLGLTAFTVIVASMLVFFLLFRSSVLSGILGKIIDILNPITIGLIIAYILNPLMQLYENLAIRLLRRIKAAPKTKSGNKTVRVICVILAALSLFFVIYGLIALLVPQLVESIRSIIQNYPVYEQNVNDWYSKYFESESANTLMQTIMSYADRFYDWAVHKLPDLDLIVTNVTSGLVKFISFLIDFVLGLIISIYVLISKEMIAAKGKRILYGMFPIRSANHVLHNLRFVDEKFGGFIIGKVIDSLIIGVICYICCSILRFPYTTLVSVVIGVTNVIPVFGPLIGAIPCAILIFVISPMKALYFIIFILLLQQFDGNILGPHILGNSTGLSGLMVVVAIVICNGIFGIAGAFIGVPLVATVVGLIQAKLRKEIDKKRLPKDLRFYSGLSSIDEMTLTPVPSDALPDGTSLYDRFKKKDKELFRQGVSRFMSHPEDEMKEDGSTSYSKIPEDPVNVTLEEAEKNIHLPIVP